MTRQFQNNVENVPRVTINKRFIFDEIVCTARVVEVVIVLCVICKVNLLIRTHAYTYIYVCIYPPYD